jgi:hypothetical protein
MTKTAIAPIALLLMLMAGPDRFELPTAGFEDQNSSTELRTGGDTYGIRTRDLMRDRHAHWASYAKVPKHWCLGV